MPARRRCAPHARPATPHRKTGAAARPEGRRRSAAWTDHVSPAGFPCVLAPKAALGRSGAWPGGPFAVRSEEHTSELQSLMRITYAVFCLKTKTYTTQTTMNITH